MRSMEAEKWFRAAAEKGHGTAQMNLAMLLPLGCAATTSCDHIHRIDHDKTSHDFSHPQTSSHGLPLRLSQDENDPTAAEWMCLVTRSGLRSDPSRELCRTEAAGCLARAQSGFLHGRHVQVATAAEVGLLFR